MILRESEEKYIWISVESIMAVKVDKYSDKTGPHLDVRVQVPGIEYHVQFSPIKMRN